MNRLYREEPRRLDSCAVGDTRPKDRCRRARRPPADKELLAGLVDPLDAVYAGNLANVEENGFQLALVRYFQIGIDARIQFVGAAFQAAYVRAGSADDRGNFRKQPGTILGAYGELHRECGLASAAPFDGDTPLRLVHEVLHLGAHAGVHGDATAARDVADDFVAGDGVAALGAVNKQVVVALDDQRSFAEPQYALDGLDQGGLGIDSLRLVVLSRFAKHAREDLARGVFAEAHGGIEVLDFGEAMVGNKFHHVLFGNFLQAAAEVARFVFEELFPHFLGFFAFLLVDPVSDFALGVRGLDKAQPVAAGMVALLRENLHHVAAGDFMAQRDHLPVDLCAYALMPYFGVHQVGKVDGRSAAHELQHAALWREGVNLHRRQVHLESGEKLPRFLKFLGPFDELSHPGDALIVVFRPGLAALVFPVRGDTFLRDAVHFLRANLHLEGLSSVQHRGMQRLVEIRPGHGDVVLETPGNGSPDVVDHAKRRVTAALRVGDHAHGEQVVDLVEPGFLAQHLAVQRIQALHAR